MACSRWRGERGDIVRRDVDSFPLVTAGWPAAVGVGNVKTWHVAPPIRSRWSLRGGLQPVAWGK